MKTKLLDFKWGNIIRKLSAARCPYVDLAGILTAATLVVKLGMLHLS